MTKGMRFLTQIIISNIALTILLVLLSGSIMFLCVFIVYKYKGDKIVGFEKGMRIVGLNRKKLLLAFSLIPLGVLVAYLLINFIDEPSYTSFYVIFISGCIAFMISIGISQLISAFLLTKSGETYVHYAKNTHKALIFFSIIYLMLMIIDTEETLFFRGAFAFTLGMGLFSFLGFKKRLSTNTTDKIDL